MDIININSKSNTIDINSVKNFLLRYLKNILLFLILFVLLIFFWLKQGIYIDNLHTKYFNLKQLYLKLDYKLLIKIDKLDIILIKKDKQNSSHIINKKNFYLFFNFFNNLIQDIDITQLKINRYKFSLKYHNHLMKIIYNKTNVLLNFINLDKVSYLSLSINNVPNIKFVKEFISLDKEIESWMYDNVLSKDLSATILCKIDKNGFDLKYLKAYGIIHKPIIYYNKLLSPLKAKYAQVTLLNSALSFNLIDPMYKNIKLYKAKVIISDILFLNQPKLKIYLLINHKVNKNLLNILRAYNIDLFKIEQLKGKSNIDINLILDLLNFHFDYKATIVSNRISKFKLLDLPLEIYNLSLNIKNSKVLINANKVLYHNLVIKPKLIKFDINNTLLQSSLYIKDKKNILSADLKLDFDFNKYIGNCFSNLYKLDFGKFLYIKNAKFNSKIKVDNNLTIDVLDYNTKILYDLKRYKLDVNISKIDNLKSYSDVAKKYKITKANFNIYSDNFTNFVILSNIEDSNISIYNLDKSKGFSFKVSLDNNHTNINFNKVKFDINDKNTTIQKFDSNLTINLDNCFIKYNQHLLKTDNAIIDILPNKKIIKARFYKDKSSLIFFQKNRVYYFKGDNFSDDMMNDLIQTNIFKYGKISFQGYQRDGVISGALNFKNSTLKNIKLLNNIFAFINTTPIFVNPLFALPELVSSKNMGFSNVGYRVKTGEILFDYDTKKSLIDIIGIDLKADSTDIKGIGNINLNNDKLDIKFRISLLKTYSQVIDKIPLLGYIVLGKDGAIYLNIGAKGTFNNPIIKTHIIKDGTKIPLDITKRILLSPLELFNNKK